MVTILWLRRDLRLIDNPALVAAAKAGPVAPVFVIDRALMDQGAASRWRLQQGLRAFDGALRQRTGQGLLILRGEAEAVLPRLARALHADAVHASDWPCPAMRAIDQRVAAALGDVALCCHPGHLLIDPLLVRTKAGSPYQVYTPFARALRAIGPDAPCPAPRALQIASGLPQGQAIDSLELAPDLFGGAAVLERHALAAGEAAAHRRLRDFLDRADGYGTGRDRLDRNATSGLAEALALGEISPRSVWAIAMERIAAGQTPDDARTFLSELLWREFAWHLLLDFPQMDRQPWRREWAGFPWQAQGKALEAWRQARTGIPVVDAGLREMRVTGRMHNRVRMIVASYLTKNLMIDWRQGLGHFADSLTDWDPASNAMNWQWVAGSGPDASPFFRIFNPQTQAQKFDPDQTYQKRWLLGFQGSQAEGARDYFDTLPSAWEVPRDYDQGDAPEKLADQRQAALHAYETMRR